MHDIDNNNTLDKLLKASRFLRTFVMHDIDNNNTLDKLLKASRFLRTFVML